MRRLFYSAIFLPPIPQPTAIPAVTQYRDPFMGRRTFQKAKLLGQTAGGILCSSIRNRTDLAVIAAPEFFFRSAFGKGVFDINAFIRAHPHYPKQNPYAADVRPISIHDIEKFVFAPIVTSMVNGIMSTTTPEDRKNAVVISGTIPFCSIDLPKVREISDLRFVPIGQKVVYFFNVAITVMFNQNGQFYHSNYVVKQNVSGEDYAFELENTDLGRIPVYFSKSFNTSLFFVAPSSRSKPDTGKDWPYEQTKFSDLQVDWAGSPIFTTPIGLKMSLTICLDWMKCELNKIQDWPLHKQRLPLGIVLSAGIGKIGESGLMPGGLLMVCDKLDWGATLKQYAEGRYHTIENRNQPQHLMIADQTAQIPLTIYNADPIPIPNFDAVK